MSPAFFCSESIALIISGLNVSIVSGSILYRDYIFNIVMSSSQTIDSIDSYMLIVVSA